MASVAFEVEVCTDCLFAIEYGAQSVFDNDLEISAERVREISEGIQDLSEQGHVALYSAADGEFEPPFSWYPCQCCHSPLGGDRHPIVGLTSG